MKTNFKAVTYKELAEFIVNMETGVAYSVTDSLEYVYGEPTVGDCALWFGFIKSHAFDVDFVTFGYYGGGEIQSFEITGKSIDEITEFIKTYAICHMEIATKYSKLLLDLDVASGN